MNPFFVAEMSKNRRAQRTHEGDSIQAKDYVKPCHTVTSD